MGEKCENFHFKEMFTSRELEQMSQWLKNWEEITIMHLQQERINIDVALDIVSRKVAIYRKLQNGWFWAWVWDIIEYQGKKYILTVKHNLIHKWNQDIVFFDMKWNILQVWEIFIHPEKDIGLVEVPSPTEWYTLSKPWKIWEKTITLWLGENHRPHVTISQSQLSILESLFGWMTMSAPWNNWHEDLVTLWNDVKPGDSGSMVVDEFWTPLYLTVKWETSMNFVSFWMPIEKVVQSIQEIFEWNCN